MKRILFYILLLFGTSFNSLFAQGRNAQMRANKSNSELSNKIFGDSDPDFKVKEIPDKWKGESAVIIAQKFDYVYTVDGKRTLNYKESTRRRIKLLDKAAVENFSTFYYYGTKNISISKMTDAFGIQIVKPDGKTRNIEKKDAITVDLGEVSSIYRTRFYGVELQYYKLAIADLEPGDILDYYLVTNSEAYNFTGEAQPLPLVMATMDGDYSILKQKINFILDRGFYINFKSTNGAPELKKNAPIDHSTYSFSLEDQDRNKVNETRWLYEFRELPTMRFQLCYSQIGKDSRYFLQKVNEPTTSVSKEEVAKKINYWYTERQYACSYYVDAIKAKMRKDHGTPSNKEDIIKWSYYYFRNIAFSKNTEKSFSANELGYMPSQVFASVMFELLKNYNIKSEICVAPLRSVSKIEDVVISDELAWFLKVDNDFIFPFKVNSNYKDNNQDYEDQDAYVISIEKREQFQKAEKIKLKVSSSADNYSKYEYKASIEDEMENIKINKNTAVKGESKSLFNSTVLENYDWEKTDYLSYIGKKEDDKPDSKNKTRLAEVQRQKSAKTEDDYKAKLKQMKEELKTDFANVVSYDEFELINDGRLPDAQELVFTEKYILGDLVKKVGPNYLVDIGKLTGGHVAISSKEIKREYDIWLNYASSSDFIINLSIPSGYTVEGLEKLNVNIDNSTGAFSVITKIEGQNIMMSIKKVYKSNFVVKEDWSKMLEFLDAAYNFTQKKIILKKA
ncbi:MAG TPA: hypothetical protein VK590_07735 [Saprospiraceae bacterium]|nr:hypothetical protein [Saprospiraceae bacterium]